MRSEVTRVVLKRSLKAGAFAGAIWGALVSMPYGLYCIPIIGFAVLYGAIVGVIFGLANSLILLLVARAFSDPAEDWQPYVFLSTIIPGIVNAIVAGILFSRAFEPSADGPGVTLAIVGVFGLTALVAGYWVAIGVVEVANQWSALAVPDPPWWTPPKPEA